jgi:hypothetical protein
VPSLSERRAEVPAWLDTAVQKALAKQPGDRYDTPSAFAHAGVADRCAYLYMYWDSSKANLEGAEAAGRKAMELRPELAEVHASRGFALSLSRQYEDARRESRRPSGSTPSCSRPATGGWAATSRRYTPNAESALRCDRS